MYYGADAVELPTELEDERGYRICLDGSGAPNGGLQRSRKFCDAALIARFEAWLDDAGQWGCVGEPSEWRKRNTIARMLDEQTFKDLEAR